MIIGRKRKKLAVPLAAERILHPTLSKPSLLEISRREKCVAKKKQDPEEDRERQLAREKKMAAGRK